MDIASVTKFFCLFLVYSSFLIPHCILEYTLISFFLPHLLPLYIHSAAKNLPELSDLGHFLKGSSAALGISRVQKSCERMQHYGKKWDEEAGVALTEESAMAKIEPLLEKVKAEYDEAEVWLKGWYTDRGVRDED